MRNSTENSARCLVLVIIIILVFVYGLFGVGVYIGRVSKDCSCPEVTRQVQDFRLGNVLLGQKEVNK